MNIQFVSLPKKEILTFEYSFYDTHLGKLLITSWEKNITYVAFSESEKEALRELRERFPKAVLTKKETVIHKQLLQYLKSPKKFTKNLNVATLGTPFQLSVWKMLLKIPFAQTVTYSQLAKKIGSPSAVRAAASAVAKNPIAILIPCHRVLPSSGGVGNYHWGSKNKINILSWEGMQGKV